MKFFWLLASLALFPTSSFALPNYGNICPSNTVPYVRSKLEKCARTKSSALAQNCLRGLGFLKSNPSYSCAMERGFRGEILRIYTTRQLGYIYDVLYIEFEGDDLDRVTVNEHG